jgi:hypothetical protein
MAKHSTNAFLAMKRPNFGTDPFDCAVGARGIGFDGWIGRPGNDVGQGCLADIPEGWAAGRGAAKSL